MAGTTVYNINKPTVAGDSGVWGGFLNTGMDTIDNEIARSRIPFVSPTYNVGGTTTLDLNQTTGARVFVFTVSGASTLAFSNVPSASFDCRVSLVITNGSAFVLTFPASVSWLAGVAPVLKATGTDIIDFETKDGGTTWFAARRASASGVVFQDRNKTTSATVDTSITSYTLAANALTTNGQALRITLWGHTNEAGNWQATVKFGATTLNAGTNTGVNNFKIEILLARNGSASEVRCVTNLIGSVMSSAFGSASEDLTTSKLIDVRGFVTTGTNVMTIDAVEVELLAA